VHDYGHVNILNSSGQPTRGGTPAWRFGEG